MTFKEKLQMELPNEICKGVPSACPTTYGYEKYEDRPCKGKGLIDYVFCEGCWNREMPNAELVKTVTLPMPPNTEPKNEIDAADYINIYTEGHGKGYTEGLNDGRHEVWELVRKLYDMKCDELEKIFDVDGGFWSVIRDFTPQEALAKLKAYEDRIEVGDIVLIYGEEAVVTRVVDEHANILFGDGVTNNMPVKELVGDKTGKHIDIKSILEQIGE